MNAFRDFYLVNVSLKFGKVRPLPCQTRLRPWSMSSAAQERLEAATQMLAGPPPPDHEEDEQGDNDGAAQPFRSTPTASAASLMDSLQLVKGEAYGYATEAKQRAVAAAAAAAPLLTPYAAEAKQLLSSRGKQLLGRLGDGSDTLKASAAEARLEWRSYLRGDDGGAALCGAAAAPFSHGAALAPELKRFQLQFERSADDAAALRLAVEQLRACEQARATTNPPSQSPCADHTLLLLRRRLAAWVRAWGRCRAWAEPPRRRRPPPTRSSRASRRRTAGATSSRRRRWRR